MPRKTHSAVVDVMGWAVLGVATGLVVGLFLGERLEWRRKRRGTDLPAQGTTATLAQSVKTLRTALDSHDVFGALAVSVKASSPGVVELGGWVDDRPTRARLMRFAREVPGIQQVLDGIRVRGEDDIHLQRSGSLGQPGL